jgi:Rad3-related DNA helicase
MCTVICSFPHLQVSRELERECVVVFDEAHNIDNVSIPGYAYVSSHCFICPKDKARGRCVCVCVRESVVVFDEAHNIDNVIALDYLFFQLLLHVQRVGSQPSSEWYAITEVQQALAELTLA